MNMCIRKFEIQSLHTGQAYDVRGPSFREHIHPLLEHSEELLKPYRNQY